MKKLIWFILIYSVCFFVLTILAVNLFDKSPNGNEMLAGAIFGSLAYLLLGFLTWIPVNGMANQSGNKVIAFTLRFCLGLIVLNFLATFAGGGAILTLELLTFDTNHDSFWVSLAVDGIYTISLFIASFAFANDKKNRNLWLVNDGAGHISNTI